MSRAILTPYQVREISKLYDGESETIDRLVNRFSLSRHLVIRAAKQGGFKTNKKRVCWTPQMDATLAEHYGRMPIDDLASMLGCTVVALILRRKRTGANSTRDVEDLTVRDLEVLTRIDHRFWQRFMADGWLQHWESPRRGTQPIRFVSVDALHKLLRAHPEVFDYRAVSTHVRGVLELDRLPDPPKFMRLTCKSDAWRDRFVNQRGRDCDGNAPTFMRMVGHTMQSCKAEGGVDFWAPIYTVGPTCPRCGCQVSRFSTKALFMDTDPGNGERLEQVAAKLGLSYTDGVLTDADGAAVDDQALLQYVFQTKRNPHKALQTFRGLLENGLQLRPQNPVPEDRLLANILDYELRGAQQAEGWQSFLAEGNVGIYWPPGEGKMFLGAMALTRLAGEHVVFCNTTTVVDQWIAHLSAHAPRVEVRRLRKPMVCAVVTTFDAEGVERCSIALWSYATRRAFDGYKPVVMIFDEAHFLPGLSAHRFSLIEAEFSLGLTATPYREDGRADLIEIMTGKSIGADWSKSSAVEKIKNIVVEVVVTEDVGHKTQVLKKLLRAERTIVFCDSIAAGKALSETTGLTFIHGGTGGDRVAKIAACQSVILSRVGDCGLDIPDLRHVIEYDFHKGARAQEAQRVGRLLHSVDSQSHTVLMTRYEFTRHAKRLTVLEDKGFKIRVRMAPSSRQTAATAARVATHPLDAWMHGVIAAARKSDPQTLGQRSITAEGLTLHGRHASRRVLAPQAP